MDCFKGNNRGIIDKVLNQYEQMVNMNLETTLNSQNWKLSSSAEVSPLTIDILEEWHRTAQEKLREERKFYVSRLLDLYEIILALTDDEFVLEDDIRNECLEYLLWELNEIIMGLVEFVQMQD